MKQKDMTKLTIGYQIRKMIFGQITALFVVDAVWLIAFSWTMDMPVGRIITSIAFSLAYFAMIYSSAGEMAKHDKKPYTQLQVNKFKGFMFGVMISVVNVIFWIAYMLIWKNFGDGASLTSIGAIVVNACFILWTVPYFGFMNPTTGVITWYSVIIMVVLPIAATGLGYLATCRDFYFADKFSGFVYVKKDKK